MRIFVLVVLALSALVAAGCTIAAVVLLVLGQIGPGLACVLGVVVFGLMARSLTKQLQQQQG
jgi:hypothetical protein